MTLEWKRWQSYMKVLSETDTHIHMDHGQNLWLLQLFHYAQDWGAMEVV